MNKSNYSIHQYKLSNKLPLTLINDETSRSVTIMVLVGAGSRYETDKLSGTAHFLEHMFFKGSKKYPGSQKLSMEMEMLGGLTNAFTSHDYTGYYIKVPHKNFKKALELIADILINPIFKATEFEKERGVIAEEIKMYDDLPYEKIKDEFNSTLFGKHPLSRNIAGTIETLNNINIEKISQFRNAYYTPGNMHLIISGSFRLEEVVKYSEKYFAQLVDNKKPDIRIPLTLLRNPKLSKHHLHINKITEQTHMVIGGFSYERNHRLEFPLKLGMTIISDGFGSRLFQTLREKYGIAYYVSGGVASYVDVGKYYIRAGISNNSAKLGIQEIIKSFNILADGGFSSDELDRAKNYYISTIINNIETGEDKAGWFGVSEILNKKHKTPESQIKEIEAISKDLIVEAWKGIISKDNILVSMISEKDISD